MIIYKRFWSLSSVSSLNSHWPCRIVKEKPTFYTQIAAKKGDDIIFEKFQKLGAADLPSVWPSVVVLQRNQSPLLVHQVVPGLGQLCQVGQQRTQIVELSLLVVTFSAEDLHQLRQTNLLLEDLKKQQNTSSLIWFWWPGRHCGPVWNQQLTESSWDPPWTQSCRSFYGGSGWTGWSRSDQRTGTLDPEASLTTPEELWHLPPKPGWDTTKNTCNLFVWIHNISEGWHFFLFWFICQMSVITTASLRQLSYLSITHQ